MDTSRCRRRCWSNRHALRASVRCRYTAGGAKTLAYEAATNAVLPFCVKEVLADPTAVAELKVKRVSDYDDVVRDHYKRSEASATSDYTFWRACGKLLEGKVEKTASK
jgi:hypothetical protein